MDFKLTITPMQKDLPQYNCLFSIDSECGSFHLSNYMEGSKQNRYLWDKILKGLQL